MNKFFAFIGIDGKSKFAFMSWIGGIFIISFILNITYLLVQMNYFFAKGKIEIEIYERIITSFISALHSIVTIVVMYFFAKNTNQNPE